MPLWELDNIDKEALAAIRELPEYKHVASALVDTMTESQDVDDYFSKWIDPDVIAVMSAEVCVSEEGAVGFVTGALVGLLLAEYRTGDQGDDTR